jgi:hypothetical protein
MVLSDTFLASARRFYLFCDRAVVVMIVAYVWAGFNDVNKSDHNILKYSTASNNIFRGSAYLRTEYCSRFPPGGILVSLVLGCRRVSFMLDAEHR